MESFKIFDDNNAAEASRQKLAQAKADFGMIPNLEGVMAQAPALLASYVESWASLGYH